MTQGLEFEHRAAIKLVDDIVTFEDEIIQDTEQILETGADVSDDWNDAKWLEFCDLLESVVVDIDNSIQTLDEYKEQLVDKIKRVTS